MSAFDGFGSVFPRPRLLGALALCFLTSCATSGGPKGDDPPAIEPVETGYGVVDRGQTVASANTVQGEDANVAQHRTLAQMLSRVPGVMVAEGAGGEVTVRIRGDNSFLGGRSPLYVMDGQIIQGLGGINPNTVESITVLKNADATAIYGSRGANGVILIKTKRD